MLPVDLEGLLLGPVDVALRRLEILGILGLLAQVQLQLPGFLEEVLRRQLGRFSAGCVLGRHQLLVVEVGSVACAHF